MAGMNDVNNTNLQLQRARELLAQGQHQEALVLALDALQSVLHNLRESLLSLQRNLAQVQEERGQVNPSQQEMEALLNLLNEKKSRQYH